ncbi:MAG: nitroreductase family protein [Candidatus Thorarchaeota archaeon]
MDVHEAIRGRRSIRKYLDKDVDEKTVVKILEAGQWAPSASNKQPWHFIIVRDPDTREKLAGLHEYGRFMSESPVVIVVLGDPAVHPKYHLADPHNAVQNMILAAYAEGLGTCWIGVRDTDIEDDFKKVLDVPKKLRVICSVAMGYSDMKRDSSRKSLDEIVSWERYDSR